MWENEGIGANVSSVSRWLWKVVVMVSDELWDLLDSVYVLYHLGGVRRSRIPFLVDDQANVRFLRQVVQRNMFFRPAFREADSGG
jgi:hypothetical protein